jgi:hypothetical protein
VEPNARKQANNDTTTRRIPNPIDSPKWSQALSGNRLDERGNNLPATVGYSMYFLIGINVFLEGEVV